MADIVDQGQWGICGFVSVLNGLRVAGHLTKFAGGAQVEMNLGELQVRLLAEVVTYLKYLIFMRSPIVGEIEDISYICAPEGQPKRNLPQLVRHIEGLIRSYEAHPDLGSMDDILTLLVNIDNEDAVTVAMTPNALLDYMKWAGATYASILNFNTTSNTVDNLKAYRDCVIGLGEHPGPDRPYNGLMHWIYVDRDGWLHNWGQLVQLTSATDLTQVFQGTWAKFMTHVLRFA